MVLALLAMLGPSHEELCAADKAFMPKGCSPTAEKLMVDPSLLQNFRVSAAALLDIHHQKSGLFSVCSVDKNTDKAWLLHHERRELLRIDTLGPATWTKPSVFVKAYNIQTDFVPSMEHCPGSTYLEPISTAEDILFRCFAEGLQLKL